MTAAEDFVICDRMLGRDGDVQLLVIGPDPEDAGAVTRHDASGWCTAIAVLVGAGCADTLTDDEVDALVVDLVPAR